MVYSNKFVVCVLLNGEPQKELANGTVVIPFNSEYSLRFRNKNDRRAVVKIYIDGENVSGGSYVIRANDYIDVKRHNDKDRSFKFVSLDSSDAVDFGKNGPNNDKVKGTIEAHFYLEKQNAQPKEVHHHHHYHRHDHYDRFLLRDDSHRQYRRVKRDNPPQQNFGFLDGSVGDGVLHTSNGFSGELYEDVVRCDAAISPSANSTGFTKSADLKDGCTVEGAMTGQTFYSVSVDLEETYTVLKLFLQGFEPKNVEPPVSVFDDKIRTLQEENERLKKQLDDKDKDLEEKIRKILNEKTFPKL